MFKNSESGSVAIIVGLCLVGVIFGIMALSIDLTKAQTGSNKTANAVDATAQGVAQYIQQFQVNYAKTHPGDNKWEAQQPSQDELQSFADNMFKQNAALDQSSATPVPYGN